jgi:hypothetical protein
VHAEFCRQSPGSYSTDAYGTYVNQESGLVFLQVDSIFYHHYDALHAKYYSKIVEMSATTKVPLKYRELVYAPHTASDGTLYRAGVMKNDRVRSANLYLLNVLLRSFFNKELTRPGI